MIRYTERYVSDACERLSEELEIQMSAVNASRRVFSSKYNRLAASVRVRVHYKMNTMYIEDEKVWTVRWYFAIELRKLQAPNHFSNESRVQERGLIDSLKWSQPGDLCYNFRVSREMW